MICRLCLKKNKNMLNFFDINGSTLEIATIVGRHFWFEPSNEDPISKVICNLCWLKVCDFNDFYETIEKAQEEFNEKSHIKVENAIGMVIVQSGPLPSKSEPIEEFGEMNEREISIDIFHMNTDRSKTESADITASGEDVDSHDIFSTVYNDDAAEDPINEDNKFNEASIKYSTDEQATDLEKGQQQQLPQQYFNNKNPLKEENSPTPETEQSTADVTSSPMKKRGRPRKNSIREQYVKIQPQSTNERERKLKSKRGRPRKNAIHESQPRTKTSEESEAHHAKSAESDAEIAKYMSLHCELCNSEMEKFTALKVHMRIKHKVIGYVRCCGKKFLKRQLLLEHIRKHLNPDCYKCDDCNRVFSDKQSMRNHFLVKHQKDEDKIFKCSQCSKKFARKYLLEQHNVNAHRDRSTICKKCNRRFATLEELHIHNRVRCFGTMCDICAKVIRGSTAFQRHQAEHMGVTLPKVQCDECGSWHKTKYALNKHKKRHAQSNELHICGICQKVTPNRSALLSHISFVHDDKRSYECNICSKSFKKAIYLREHMAGHTGEVLYRCPHCPKTFNSNANMHSHRKKMHPREFEELRKLRQQSAHLSVPPIPTIAEMSRKKNASVSDATINQETVLNATQSKTVHHTAAVNNVAVVA